MSELAPPHLSPRPSADGGVDGRRWRRVVAGMVLVVAVLAVLAGLGVYVSRTDAGDAAAGDCLRRRGRDSVAVVACHHPDAEFEVVGRVEDQTEREAGTITCDNFAERGATQVYWEGEEGGTGFVLCLIERKV